MADDRRARHEAGQAVLRQERFIVWTAEEHSSLGNTGQSHISFVRHEQFRMLVIILFMLC